MSGGNDSLAAVFGELVQLTILEEGDPNSFRVRAYERARETILSHRGELGALSEKELTKLDGIGSSTAKKIREFFQSGAIAKVEELRKKYPPEFVELSRIPGLGPKTLARLRAELGVRNVEDLRAALAGQKLREVKGLGEKAEQKIRLAVERIGTAAKENRRPIAEAMPIARELVAALEALPAVERAQYCGSLRRLRETVADVDIVVASREPSSVREAFLKMPAVREALGGGDTKTSVLTATGLQVDLRVVDPRSFGAACQYFTGSKAHNIRLRQRALERGWLLNEYGLTDNETGRVIASETEEDVYRALGLPLVPPPMREDRGEIERAEAGELLPDVRLADVRGDLHVHTSLSGDGRSPLEDVLAAATARGYEYLAITDHAEDLYMNGVSRRELAVQRTRIDALRGGCPAMAILHGAELNIGRTAARLRRGVPPHARVVRGRRSLAVRSRPRRADAPGAGARWRTRRVHAIAPPHRPADRPPPGHRRRRGRGAEEGGGDGDGARDQRRARPPRPLERGALPGARPERHVRDQHRHSPRARARAHGVGRAAGHARLRRSRPGREPLAARALPRVACRSGGEPVERGGLPDRAARRADARDARDGLPAGDRWLFEPKWDGFRAIVFRDGERIYTQSRDLKPLDRYFPELADAFRASLPERCVVDGEIVIARRARARLRRAAAAPASGRVAGPQARGRARRPSFVAFDLLAEGDEDLRARPQAERRQRLERALASASRLGAPDARVAATARLAEEWFHRFEGAGLDGVVAKHEDAPYQPGKRVMVKVKHVRSADCGWPASAGTRTGRARSSARCSSACSTTRARCTTWASRRRSRCPCGGGSPRSSSRCGRTPSRRTPGGLGGEADGAQRDARARQSRWSAGKDLSWEPLRVERVCEVKYDHLQGDRFRHAAVFLRWRPDKAPRDCRYDQLEVTPPAELAELFRRTR